MVGRHSTKIVYSPFFLMILVLALSISFTTKAETIFEGYYKIAAGEKILGYAIQRYEFDAKSKTFTSKSFLKVVSDGVPLQEALVAVASDSFDPKSYQYTLRKGQEVKIIDASFAKERMTLKTSDGKTEKNEVYKIPPKTYLSTFLAYLLLQKKYAVGLAFAYSAVAEEEGASYNGTAKVMGEETMHNQKVFRIENTFKNAKFTSFVSAKAEVLGTLSTDSNVRTILVAKPSEATAGFNVEKDKDALVKLFGAIPLGKANIVATPTVAPTTPTAPNKPSTNAAPQPSANTATPPTVKPPANQPEQKKAASEPAANDFKNDKKDGE